MRNDRRKDRTRNISGRHNESGSIKNALYITGTILALGVIAFFITVMIYNNSLEKVYTDLEGEKIGEVTDTTNNEIEEASTNLGRTIEEMENEVQSTSVENEEETVANVETKKEEKEAEPKKEETKKVSETKEDKSKENKDEKAVVNETQNQETKEETKQEELKFAYPVDGEIMKEYAKDNLVYSETLKEWVTHDGVDIKADKTTVVKASEKGKVTAIKNDPRYGTTVIIEHSGGFETRYANLLTAEFVNVGEEVSKGQTIGTVGNTGAFEVLDDSHLHFEILKNEEYQDPMLYIG